MSEVRLSPMGEDDFQRFREVYVREMAEENINAGIWKAMEAMERSQRAFEDLLPEGRDAARHHFFLIIDTLTGQSVGHLWFKQEEGPDGPVGFLFDLCVDKKHRGKGFGTAAIKALDSEAQKMGLRAMRLNVLSNKAVAVHLYESRGYWPRTYEMVKEYPAKR